MIQIEIERRQREQLLREEVALLKSCGGEIRKTDYEAADLARLRGLRNTAPPERVFKDRWVLRALLRAMTRQTRGMPKVDAARLRRRPGL
jgi:hypothetical protein